MVREQFSVAIAKIRAKTVCKSSIVASISIQRLKQLSVYSP